MKGLVPNWQQLPLGTVCRFVNGRAFKTSEWTASGIPIIRIQNLNKEGAPFNFYDGHIETRFAVERGDLLFAWSGTPGTSFGAHIWNGDSAVLNQHIFKVEFSPSRMDASYLQFAINDTLDTLIAGAHGGVGLRHITKGALEKTLIPVPPLDHQRTIGQELRRLVTRIANARGELRSVHKIGQQYRDSVLARAFGSSSSNDHLYVAFETLIDDGPSNGWSPKTGVEASGALTLKLTATTSGKLRLDDGAVKRIYEQPGTDSKYWLKTGDLLIQRANALEHLGAAAIFEGPALTYIYPDLMMRVRVKDATKRAYLWRYLNSPMARALLQERATGTSGSMPKISNGTLRTLPVPVPRSGDFRRAVDFIDRSFASLDVVLSAADQADVLLTAFENQTRPYLLSGIFLQQIALIPTGTSGNAPPIVAPQRSKQDASAFRSKELAMLNKTRADVSADHLVTTLLAMGGTSAAYDLWHRSEMVVDEFYKQLRQEIALGEITMQPATKLLEVERAP